MSTIAGNQTGPILSSFDILERKDIPKLFLTRGMQRLPFILELNAMGSAASMDQQIYYHWEDNAYMQAVQNSTAVSAGATGAPVTIPLNASMIENNTTWIRINDVLKVEDVAVIVQSIGNNAVNIVVRPFDVTKAIPAIPANSFIGFVGNAWSDNSGQPNALVPKLRKVSHRFQIIKETTGASGSSLSDAIWVNEDSSGRQLNGYYSQNNIQGEYRQLTQTSNIFLFQELNTNAIVDPTNSNATTFTTEGFFPWCRTSAEQLPVAAGAFDVTSLAEIAAYAKSQFSGNYVYSKMGFQRYKDVSNNLFEFFKNANIVATELRNSIDGMNGGKELAGFVDFEMIKYMSMNFVFSEFSELSDPSVSNYPDSNDPWLAAFFQNDMYRDPETNSLTPIIGYRWKEGNGYSRRMEMWRDGAAGGQAGPMQYVGQIDQLRTFWRSEVGTDWKCANKVTLVEI